jgi:hypothetical protein
MAKRVRYSEGDWFAVPLPSGGYATGVVSRVGPKRRVVFGYFFGPRRRAIPALDDIKRYKPAGAVLVGRFGDLSLTDGTWPMIGRAPNWNRTKWPMPHFKRVDEDERRYWEEIYSDDDPNLLRQERPSKLSAVRDLPEAGLMGSDYAAEKLDELC